MEHQRAFVRCLILLVVGCLASPIDAQEFDERFEHWPVDLKINGRIVIAGELEDAAVLKEALRRSDGEKRKDPDKDKSIALLFDREVDDSLVAKFKSVFEDAGNKQPIAVARASDEIAEQIAGLLQNCDVFCWRTSEPLTEAQRSGLIAIRPSLQSHLAAGGTIVTIGPAAKLLSACSLAAPEQHLQTATGLNLVPDCVIETNYDDASADRGRLLSALATHPRCVGIGIEKHAAVVLSGRKLRVVGEGRATCLLMANERQPLRVQTIARQASPRQPPEDYLIDLTEWRRDAIDRTIEPFPAASPRTPSVENGTLVIVGGGELPSGLMARVVELAGGAEHARMVYVPCSEDDEVPEKQSTVEAWIRMGVKHATFIHTKDRNQANGDDAFLAPLRSATGIWFGGGRQWNLADSYYGTKAHQLMKDVLKRGGVIGGSSAGASIQARYLARATPIGNFRIMAPGYERGGLGFISGVAIDQHFSQRGRQKDMTQLVDRYPQLLGIGLDEATAIIVRKSAAEVVGKGRAHFYDRKRPVYPDRPDYIALSAGSSFDLAERKVLKDASQPETSAPSD